MSESAEVTDTGTGWEFRPATAAAQSPDEQFPRTGWGHRGYEEQAVDEFAGRMRHEFALAQQQIDDLRIEVDRLHRYIRRQWATVAAPSAGAPAPASPDLSSPLGQPVPGTAGTAGAAGAGGQADPQRSASPASPAAQARAVLTQAQEIADRRIAEATARLAESDRAAAALLARTERLVADRLGEAEHLVALRLREADVAAAERLDRADTLADDVLTQARRAAMQKRARAQDDVGRLLALGRGRYEEILVQAHRRADEAAELALHDFEDAAYHAADSGRARAELDMKAAYLRTFATVSRAALQAALDVTGREFDRVLGAHGAIGAPGPARPSSVEVVPAEDAELPAARGIPGQAPVAVAVQGQARLITMPALEGAIELVRVSRAG